MKKIIYVVLLTSFAFYSCSGDDDNEPIFDQPTNGSSNICDANDSLNATSITETTAILEWFGPSRDFYQVEYSLNGFTLGNGTMLNSNENSINISGLSADTAYDFYVRGNCGGSSFSDWTGPHSFVTD